MQRTNLAWHYAYNQPLVSYFEQNNTLTWAERHSADNLHSSSPETFSAGNFTCQPSGSGQDADNQYQG